MLKPGRELDALIAEKVMEHTLEFCIGSHEYYVNGRRHLLPIYKHYSTDIAAAWEVVEQLKQANDFQLLVDHGQWCFNIFRGKELVRAYGETAPHAICLAALEYVGYDLNT